MIDSYPVSQPRALAEEKLMQVCEPCLNYSVRRETRQKDILLTVDSHKQQYRNPKWDGESSDLLPCEIQHTNVRMSEKRPVYQESRNHEIEFDGYIAVMEPRREGMTMPKAYHTHEQETERIY